MFSTDDLDADFRVFYRMDGIGEGDYGDLSGPRFFAMASRCSAYDGAMKLRVMNLQALQESEEEVNKHDPSSLEVVAESPAFAGDGQFPPVFGRKGGV